MDDLVRQLTAGGTALALRLAGALLVLLGFWLGAALVARAGRRLQARAEPARQDAIGILTQSARFGLIGLGLITALGTTGVNVTALVAGLGLTGFALGFALRDVLSNLLAGLLLLIFRPFQRRDYVMVSGFEGVVTAIDLRYTVLQAEDRTVLIPNSILFTNPIALRPR